MGARRLRQSHKTDAQEHCKRWLRLTLGDVPRGAATASVSSARFFLVAGAFLTQVHGGTRRWASPICLPSFSMLRRASQNDSSDAPDVFAAAALATLIDAAQGVLSDNGIRCSTWTWHHHHTRATFVTQGSLGHDEHALPGRAFLAPAPSQAATHLVITRKEIRCTRCHAQMKTIKFVNPTRNEIMDSRNMKTCRRWAKGNFHLTAALDRVEIPTVFSGEDATQWTALLVAQERLLAGDAQQLRLDPRPAIHESTKLCFHAFQVPLQRRGGRRNRLSVSDFEVGTPGAGARRRSSHGDGGCVLVSWCLGFLVSWFLGFLVLGS